MNFLVADKQYINILNNNKIHEVKTIKIMTREFSFFLFSVMISKAFPCLLSHLPCKTSLFIQKREQRGEVGSAFFHETHVQKRFPPVNLFLVLNVNVMSKLNIYMISLAGGNILIYI